MASANLGIIDPPISKGGEGAIHNTGSPGLVVKIYHPDKRTAEREYKLKAMLGIKLGLTGQLAWPQNIVYDNGDFAGFVMPKAVGKKLQDVYIYDYRKGTSWTNFITIAMNLSVVINGVHEIGQIIGDLKSDNILVDTNTGRIMLVDTDSFHIRDAKGRLYRCGVATPLFTAPELHGLDFLSPQLQTFTVETDRFALAVLVFLLLMNGAHPYACATLEKNASASKFQPVDNITNGLCPYFNDSRRSNIGIPWYAPNMDCLPQEVQQLFYRAFVEGHKRPVRRPSAKEWFLALDKLKGQTKQCGHAPDHLYYVGAKECPWCKVESNNPALPKKQAPHTAGVSSVGWNMGSPTPNTSLFSWPTGTSSVKPPALFCYKCGRKLESGWKFCDECGAPV
jgi:DNA-binding helix-hairpin-helix protein with protein kinase domain